MLKLNPSEPQDKRANPRLRISRTAKVFNPLTRRYYAAQTIDMSRGGAMLSVSSPRTLLPGDEIDVAIAWDDRQIIPQTSMTKAQVVRVVGRMGDHQAVGVRFDQELALSAAA